jgi:hypothetical protein
MSTANVKRRARVYAIGTPSAPGLAVPIAAKQPEKSQNLIPFMRPVNIALAPLHAWIVRGGSSENQVREIRHFQSLC